jgi:hypothetical protein
MFISISHVMASERISLPRTQLDETKRIYYITCMLSTISLMLPPPRDTPRKLPPARFIFSTVLRESWVKNKENHAYK